MQSDTITLVRGKKFPILRVMALKSSKQKNSSSTLARDALALLFLFAALFTFLALFSFSAADPSLFTASKKNASNLGGLVGSHWASFLLQVFGAAAFMQALIFLLAGVALLRRVEKAALWLAVSNYFLLLIACASFFGLSNNLLYLGGSQLPMGGLVGSLLGGFLQSHLNTVGAALLTGTLLVFAISLSTKISVRDMALYAWWALSKTSLYVCGILLYASTQIWTQGQKLYEQKVKPMLKNMSHSLQAEAAEFLAKRKEKKQKEQSPRIEVVEPPNPIRTDTSTESLPNNVIPLRTPAISSAEADSGVNTTALTPMDENSASLSEVTSTASNDASQDPEIITDKDRLTSDAEVIFKQEAQQSEKASGASAGGLFGMMKKAVSQNDKTVKQALGKKVNYKLPSLQLLETPIQQADAIDEEELKQKSRMIQEKLAEHKIQGHIEAVKYGPVVTMYEFKPGPGVKVNSIETRSDDLAMGLSAESVRIVAPIPGRDVVGIEVPNKKRKGVFIKEIVGSESFQSRTPSIPIAIGKDIFGKPQTADLKKMPHLLVAGTTGAGKSVFINSLLASLLYRFTPEEMNLILIDPKQIELTSYNDIPHLLLPVVTEPKKASLALHWAVQEMERRYRVIAKAGVRDIETYNQKFEKLGSEGMTELVNKNLNPNEDAVPAEKMPKLVIVIDELADLMMTAKADVENNICRIAQKARAAGMHLVLATQRPSTDVVTGLIKANMPSRICFKVSSKIDSRVIFESGGAEKLLGQGDMLYMPPGDSRLVRMHGAYIKDDEIDQITSHWKSQGAPNYREDILIDPEEELAGMDGLSDADTNDPLYQQALDIAYSMNAVSASFLQRRLSIGYNKAARFVEMMEAQGIVGPANGSKPRPVIAPRP